MPDAALRLVDVTYTYSPGQRPLEALAQVDLDVSRGEFVTLVGPSGCGKTTLLRLVAGLARPSSGSIVIGGNGDSRAGFVFQGGALMPWRTVRANIELPLELDGIPVDARRSRAREMMELVGLVGFEDAYPRQLSGGMRQRVALARALADDPALLLLDEPFASLDAFSRERMNDELQRIWLTSSKTVVMVTHDIQEAVFLSDRVVVLSQRPGRVKGIFTVPFEHPRPSHIRYDREFAALAMHIREAAEDRSPHGDEESVSVVAEFF